MNITKKPILLLSILIIIGAAFRLYNLNWGAPYYFHPDERNIASAISQLHFPNQLNPHFFAYGSFPLYFIYLIGLIQNFFTACHFSFSCSVTFEQAIILSRLVSSFLSILLIPISYVIGDRLKKGTGILTATLTTFSIGLIQFAHFGTVEMILTFFSLLLFYGALHLVKSTSFKGSLCMGIILGILISTKISSLVLLTVPVLVYAISEKNSLRQKSIRGLGFLFFQLGVAGLIFVLSNPFVFLDSSGFISSMQYESSVGFGTLPVFYTAEFIKSTPILFQLLRIYPFLLNPVILTLFLVSLIFSIMKITDKKVFLLLFFFFLLFFSQAFLFVKWTRYMLPTLPFIYLLISQFFSSFHTFKKALIPLCVVASIIWGISFFVTAYYEKDTRLQAAAFAEKNIPANTSILSEVYDLGIVPFNTHYPKISLFNMYELDNGNPEYTWETLMTQLERTNVIILPSQRIIKTRLSHPVVFPVGSSFYRQLADGALGFKKIYQTPCSLFCQIAYLGDPVNRFEQTATVFDRPTVFLYKK